jgi:hypothetical protein
MLIILISHICHTFNDEYPNDMARLLPNKLIHVDIINRNYHTRDYVYLEYGVPL